MRWRYAVAPILAVAVFVLPLFSCEEDEKHKGPELIRMIEDALDFVISDTDEVKEDEIWDITLAIRGVERGRAELRLIYDDEFGWILKGLDELVDDLPEWINPDRVAYEVAESYDLEYEEDIGPFTPVSTHMDTSELRRAVLSMAGAFATLDALVWSAEED